MRKLARLNVKISDSTKNRLDEYAESRGVSQGDVTDDALRNFFEHMDRKHSAPDLVLERINTLVMSVMQLNMAVGEIRDKIEMMEGDG